MNKFLNALTIIGIPIAVTGIVATYTKNLLYLLGTFFGCLVLILLVYFLIFLVSNWKNGDWLNRLIYIFTHNPNPAYVYTHIDCTYEFLSREKMRFSKEMGIESKRNCLKYIDGRYNWTKPGAGRCELSLESSKAILANTWDDLSWHYYLMQFNPPLLKSEPAEMKIVMENLEDPERQSALCLSVDVAQKTKFLSLHVKFPRGLNATNAQYLIYNIQGGAVPIHKEELQVSHDEIEVNINYPRVGYKYFITWEFEND